MAFLNNPVQYTVIPQNILMDKRLSLRDRGMLVTLISLPDKWNFSTRGLCSLFPDGLTAVTSAVQSLEKLGYLKRTQLFDQRGKFTDVRWDIDRNPVISEQTCTEQPCTENPYTDDTDTVNASTENHPQYNINTFNTKKENINLSKKERKLPSYDEIIAEYTENGKLREALTDYIKMRQLNKKPITNAALKMLLDKLDKLESTDGRKIAVVYASVLNNWNDIYPLREPDQQGSFDTNEFYEDAVKRGREKL